MYLRHSRRPDPDLEGFERLELEGDPALPTPDAIASLRPFGRDVPNQSLGTLPDPAQGPEERMVGRARGLAALGRRLAAKQILEQFLTDEPRALEARLLLSELEDQSGDTDRAIEQVTKALAVAKNDPGLLTRRGALYARAGRAHDAEQDFLEAGRRDPSYGPAYRYLGMIRLRRGRPDEAVVALERALELVPDDADATLHLGEALAAQGQAERALGILQRAAALCPSDPRAYKLMGRLLDRMGRTDEAMVMHKKAREVTTA